MRLLPALIHFVKYTSFQYTPFRIKDAQSNRSNPFISAPEGGILNENWCKIDESHAIGHAMDVLHYSQSIVNATARKYPYLREQEPVIYTAALIHDMVDRKYREPKEALNTINSYLCHRLKPVEIETVKHIISTMSYSHVKKEGFPLLGNYQMAYHVVREADLLAAYDFDRAVIYRMHHSTDDFTDSFDNSRELFENRMFRHDVDGLFVTDYSKKKSKELAVKAQEQIESWKKVMDSYEKYV